MRRLTYGRRIIVFIRASGIYYDSRAIKEIKALVDGGYKVKIIGWDRTGKALENCKQIFSDIIDNVGFRFFNIQIAHLGIRNLDKLLKWMKYIRFELDELCKEADIFAIHACDLDTGLISQKIAKRNKSFFVYDIYDYYSDSHSMPEFLRGIVSNIENRVINRSDATIICTEERKEQIKQAYPKRIVIIHNSPNIAGNSDCIEKSFDYIYCGTLARGRLIKEILELYPQHSNVRMIFGGDGEFSELCRELDDKYENFSYVGVVPYSEVLELEKKSKCISAIYDPSIRNHRLCAPNKFYEALAIGVPLVVCKGTGIDIIVEKNKIGEVINYDANEFYHSIERLINDDKREQYIDKKARELYDKYYKWDYMKEKIISLYGEL